LRDLPDVQALLGVKLRFKCENLQHTGSFKTRGACNHLFSLDEATAQRGIVTHSSGNHAAAVARAAQRRGMAASIVMPRNSLPNKIEAVRGYGIGPSLCEPTAEARQQAADEVIARTGATMVHPYDDPRTIAGQGTVALEWFQQEAFPDVILVPVGGGGLLSGTLITVKNLRPSTHVIGVEPAAADDAHRSLQSGRIERPTRYDTVADGLRTPLGEWTFPVIRKYVDDLLLVEETEIIEATRLLLEVGKTVVEPSGAVSLAAVLKHRDRFAGREVGVILSGGNLNLDHLPWQTGLKI